MAQLVLTLLVLTSFAPALAQGRDLCLQWCKQNIPYAALSCIALAALGTGPCYICGPHKTSASEQLCSGSCAQTNTDHNNCGKCGNVCPAGSNCSSGACIICTGFQAQATFDVGSGPLGVAVGDFNRDGHLDIVAANHEGNTVSVLLGTGSGSFQAQAIFDVGSVPIGVAVGDFNGDSYLDIVAANQVDNTVSVLLGTGSGSFQAQATFDVGSGPYGVAVGDFNGDSYLDIVAANQVDNTVSVLLGTGSGSFQAQATFDVGSGPLGVAVGDFNGDSHLDIVATNAFSSTVSVLLGTGSGTFQAQAPFDVGSDPLGVAVGDFNGDGHLDIVAANAFANTVSVLLGTGSGSFQAQAPFDVGSRPISVAVGDFNRDSHLDIVATNLGDNTVSVLLGTGSGSFQAQATFDVGSSPYGVAVGGFNGDSHLDIVAANQNSSTTGAVWPFSGQGAIYVINSVHPPYPVLVVSFIFAGLGNGVEDAAWNAWISNMANANEVLGFLHGIYGAGAVISPLIATSMIAKGGLPWYYFYYVMLCALFLLGYVGVEVALGGWIVTFMIRVRQGGAFASGMTATGFWLGITVGRVILGFVTPRVGENIAISGYIAYSMAFGLVLWLVPQFYASAVAVSLQGFFLGPLFPGAIVMLTKLLPRHLHVTSIGFVAAFGGSGAAILPFAVGVLA
ncbi:hypothetical protein N7486_009450 [Penicillium sp. IBT 16267x]|nr:hypothetical protein N7486_009450 [Penicillium sp. IBT 16267x]